MSDLIDRQAAIATAISGRIRTLPTTEDGENWIRVNEVRDSLLSLPTALHFAQENKGVEKLSRKDSAGGQYRRWTRWMRGKKNERNKDKDFR